MLKQSRSVLEAALIEFQIQRQRIKAQIADLRSQLQGQHSGQQPAPSLEAAPVPEKKRRHLSAATRRRIAAAQRRRRAAVKKNA